MKAYLLAAGHGTRAGGPKAFKLTNGQTMLERQIGFLLTIFKAEDIAVAIQETWLTNCRRLDASIHWIAVDPDLSPLASLQSLMKRSPIVDWASLHHVDMPVFDKTLFIPARDAEAIIPSFEGKKGHPVLLSRKLQEPILALDPGTDRLDHFLRGRTTAIVEVSSAVVLANENK